jgi:hypothetical protein
MGRSLFAIGSWNLLISIAFGGIAFGLYRGWRWVWVSAIAVTGILTLIGIAAMFIKGFSPAKLVMLALHISIILNLLSSKTRSNF